MRAGRVNIGRLERAGGSAVRLASRTGQAIRAALLAESDRWPLWLPVALGAGICVYFGLRFEPGPWVGGVVTSAALVLLVLCRRRVALWWMAAALSAAAIGFTAAQLRTLAADGPRLQRSVGPVIVAGQVLESEAIDKGHRIVLGTVRAAGLLPEETPRRVRLRLARGDRPPAPGAWIELRAALNPLPEPAMPGAFDFQRHAFFQELGAVGYALGPITIRQAPDQPKSWRTHVEAIRQDLDSRLRAGFAQDGSDATRASIAGALITGKRADIPDDVLDAMRDSGLAHLLAISGMNFAFVAGFVFILVRAALALIPPLALRAPIKKWAAAAAFVTAFGYLLLSGATPPTQRAFLMLSLALLAVLADRMEVSMRPVAWAALLMLLAAPEILVGASFQLSFAAVIGLVAAYEAIRDRRREIPPRAESAAAILVRPTLYVAGVAFTSVVAGVATAPFSAYHFNQLATYGVLANLVAVPVTAFWVMPAGVAALAAMPLGLERWPLAVMGSGIDLIVAIARTIAAWPGAVWRVPAIPDFALALISLGGLWLALWRRIWRLFGLALIAAGVLAGLLVRPPDLLAAGDGRLIALRGADGTLWVSTLRADRFVREVWERRTAAAAVRPWPRQGQTEDGLLHCDRLGCVASFGPHRIGLPADAARLADDCGTMTAIVARTAVPPDFRQGPCRRAAVTIDGADLRRDGGHALWLQPDGGIRIATVREMQGDRPWRVTTQPRRPGPSRSAGISSGAAAPPADPES